MLVQTSSDGRRTKAAGAADAPADTPTDIRPDSAAAHEAAGVAVKRARGKAASASSAAVPGAMGSIPPLKPSDLLTRILLSLRLEGVEYGRCLLRAPWAVAYPARPEAQFHFVAHGSCWLLTPGAEWLPLKAGDAVLLPRGGLHILASEPDLPTVDFTQLARRPVGDKLYLLTGEQVEAAAGADAAPGTDVLFCGAMRFNLDPLHPLMAMMPDVMRANDLSQRDPSVPMLLEAMEREVALDRVGACGILARLADVLAASIIRAWVECACNSATGWIAAVQCPSIGKVLAAIHAQPERNWTVPELAGLMGASRSRFAEAFTRTVGDSPARYVAKIKMFQARRWIAEDGMRVAVAADRLGYDSEASFSRAFKRIVGHAPGSLRKVRGAAAGAEHAAAALPL